jgi:signal transduction histidine kinase
MQFLSGNRSYSDNQSNFRSSTGLSHNIRNELSIILGKLDFSADRHAELPDGVRADLDTVEGSAERILRVAEKARRVDKISVQSEAETVIW